MRLLAIGLPAAGPRHSVLPAVDNLRVREDQTMGKRLSITLGVMLILIGALSLAYNLLAPWLLASVWVWALWQLGPLWPLVIVGAGLLSVMLPLLVRGRRGLGGLYFLGMLVLTTGCILLYTNFLDAWAAWEWLWPLVVLGVAAGFLFAAMHMRVAWLLIPAIIIGANGLLFQYCALTGLWEVWAVLWTIEPLSVGLGLLAANVRRRSPGLTVAGLILCGLAAAGQMGMSAIFPQWWLLSALGPVMLVAVGLLTLINGLARGPAALRAAPVEPVAGGTAAGGR